MRIYRLRWGKEGENLHPNIPNGVFHAFTYSPFPPPDVPFGSASYYADESQVYIGGSNPIQTEIGWNEDQQGTWTSEVTSIPEPSEFLLLFIALGAVGLIAWRFGAVTLIAWGRNRF